MDHFINFNGEILPADQPIFRATSRAARFGDGLFETMRAKNGRILFGEHHAFRLFSGLHLLRFKLPAQFDWTFLEKEISTLIEKNNCGVHARVRLMVTRGEGGITDEPVNSPQYLIECWPTEKYTFNEEGMTIGIFEDAKKSIDKYSNLKTSNFLLSAMAAITAKEKGVDELLLLNSDGRICDGTISNVFWIKGEVIYTPSLKESCIAGIMRHYLMTSLPSIGLQVTEATCDIEELRAADEIFLTNVVRGIRWVKAFRSVELSNLTTSAIYKEVLSPFL